MQLQKLVYLAHGWNLAVNAAPLVEDDFEAWNYGPVLRRLYNATNMYGDRAIPDLIRWGQDTPFRSDDDGDANTELDPAEEAVLDRVWANYGAYPAFRLSALTHEPDSPWTSTFNRGRNGRIPNDEIENYFVRLANRQGHNVPA